MSEVTENDVRQVIQDALEDVSSRLSGDAFDIEMRKVLHKFGQIILLTLFDEEASDE